MRRSVGVKGVAILLLFAFALCIWYAAWREDRGGILTVSFLNVGQGDAIFIDAPSGRQVLIDGGPDAGVLRQLGQVMPWWDRSIDVVIATDADPEHIGGLTDVLERYDIATIVQSNAESATSASDTFENAVAARLKQGTKLVTAQRGQIFDLGDGAYLEILFPDRSDPSIPSADDSVLARLVYSDTSFMLTGEASQGIENYLAMLGGASLKSDVLLVGHNGAKTSSSPLFVGYVSPTYAVISHGCDPKSAAASSTLDTMRKFDVQISDTCVEGTVAFVSDGRTISKK